MNRYFIVKCDKEGKPVEHLRDGNVETEMMEIAPPTHYVTLPFCIGILVGCILMRIFG